MREEIASSTDFFFVSSRVLGPNATYRKWLAMAFILSVVEAAAELYSMYVTMTVIDPTPRVMLVHFSHRLNWGLSSRSL